jgi:hypothetical protein
MEPGGDACEGSARLQGRDRPHAPIIIVSGISNAAAVGPFAQRQVPEGRSIAIVLLFGHPARPRDPESRSAEEWERAGETRAARRARRAAVNGTVRVVEVAHR